MKKVSCIFLCFYLIGNFCFAQSGQIDSLKFFPANPTEVDSVYIIADVSFGNNNCVLDFSYNITNGDSILLKARYCVGNVLSSCYKTDTFNLGVLPAGNYSLDFLLELGPNNCNMAYVTIDHSFNNPFAVGLFTGINVSKEKSNFSLFPNPTNNAEVNLSNSDNKPYTITCYNSLGILVFEMQNVTGNQEIRLPDEKGIYLIKVADIQSKGSIFKCINN